jgi:hypothetical protein
LNLLEYWGLKLIELADPTSRVGHNKYGYSIYYLNDPARPIRPENNQALEFQDSLLAQPTKQAILEWQKHANENLYRLVFVLVPRKEHLADIAHYPDYYSQVKTYLKSHSIEYIDLTVAKSDFLRRVSIGKTMDISTKTVTPWWVAS